MRMTESHDCQLPATSSLLSLKTPRVCARYRSSSSARATAPNSFQGISSVLHRSLRSPFGPTGGFFSQGSKLKPTSSEIKRVSNGLSLRVRLRRKPATPSTAPAGRLAWREGCVPRQGLASEDNMRNRRFVSAAAAVRGINRINFIGVRVKRGAAIDKIWCRSVRPVFPVPSRGPGLALPSAYNDRRSIAERRHPSEKAEWAVLVMRSSLSRQAVARVRFSVEFQFHAPAGAGGSLPIWTIVGQRAICSLGHRR